MDGKQLKNSILQWAIQGKLVPQDPNDEPASVLLERIRAEKARLVKDGKIKKDKNESIIFRGDDNSHYEKFLATGEVKCINDEIPFEIPDGWEWCRLCHVTEVARGGSPRPIKDYITESPSGINWIKIGDTEKGGKFIFSTRERIKPEGMSKSRFVHKGDFLLTNSMSFGRPYIAQVEGCIHDGWLVISLIGGAYCQDFLYYLLSSNFAYAQFSSKVAGAVVQNLNSDKVANSLFPIPPKTEQERIVQKIETILPKVHQYEELFNELASINTAIHSKLKKSILQEAIQGRLVPQIAEEGTAEELLEQIRQEKQKLVKEGKLKKKDITDSVIYKGDDNKYYEQVDGQVVDISEDIPFDIPDNWSWCRLGVLTNMRIGKTPTRGDSSFWQDGVHPWVSISDIPNNGVVISTKEKVSDYAAKTVMGTISPAGSLIMSFKLTVGKTAFLAMDAYHNEDIVTITPFSEDSEQIKKYLACILPLLTNYGDTKDAIKGKTLNSQSLNALLIPLPPTREQERILQKFNQCLLRIEHYR